MIFTNIVPRVSETDGVGHINNVFVPIWFEAGRREIFRIFSPNLDFVNWKLALVKVTVEYVDQLYLAENVEIKIATGMVADLYTMPEVQKKEPVKDNNQNKSGLFGLFSKKK